MFVTHAPAKSAIWSMCSSCFKSDNTPLTSKNTLWRRIPAQNPLYLLQEDYSPMTLRRFELVISFKNRVIPRGQLIHDT